MWKLAKFLSKNFNLKRIEIRKIITKLLAWACFGRNLTTVRLDTGGWALECGRLSKRLIWSMLLQDKIYFNNIWNLTKSRLNIEFYVFKFILRCFMYVALITSISNANINHVQEHRTLYHTCSYYHCSCSTHKNYIIRNIYS